MKIDLNKDEFITEVNNSSLKPNNFEQIYDDFQRFQELAWNSLLAFHHVCENNGIRYQLAFGSLLGAIRDNGQIPWDYDIDVFVVSEDRELLVKCLENELDSNYYYDCAEKNSKCRNEMIRICPKGYRSEALHVDVFFLIGTPENAEEFESFTKRVRFLCDVRFEKLVNVNEEYFGRHKAIILHSLKKIRYIFYNTNKMHEEYLDLCSKYSVYSASKTVNANGYAGKYFIPSELIRETELKTIKNVELRIPCDYDAVLKILYGDYHLVSNLDQRLDELLTSYKRLKRFETNNN